VFHTSSSFHFILQICCVVWLFFPALCQLVVWAWSVFTRQRAAMALQLVLLSSPLAMVQRRRGRRGAAVGGPGGGGAGATAGAMTRGGPSLGAMQPSMVMSMATKPGGGKDEDAEEEEAAAAVRRQPIHFSFLGLHYWPAIIKGPKKTGSASGGGRSVAAAAAVARAMSPGAGARRPMTQQSRSRRTGKVASYPSNAGGGGGGGGVGQTTAVVPQMLTVHAPAASSPDSRRASVVVVVDNGTLGADPGPSSPAPAPSPSHSTLHQQQQPDGKGAGGAGIGAGTSSVTELANVTREDSGASGLDGVGMRHGNNSSGSGLRSGEGSGTATVVNGNGNGNDGGANHVIVVHDAHANRMSMADGGASAFRTILESMGTTSEASNQRTMAAVVAVPRSPRNNRGEVQMMSIMPSDGTGAGPAPSPPPAPAAAAAATAAGGLPPPLTRVRSILSNPLGGPPPLKRERSLAVAIPAVAALRDKEREKEKDKDKDAPATTSAAGTVAVPSPGGPGLQRTRTRRLGASNPSYRQPLSGTYPFTDPNAAAAALGPRPDSSAPQSIEQLVDMSGLPAPSLLSLSQPLLKGVNGRFSSGQLIALMGKSGCGKRQVENQIFVQR
jgi:hypothetical protein